MLAPPASSYLSLSKTFGPTPIMSGNRGPPCTSAVTECLPAYRYLHLHSSVHYSHELSRVVELPFCLPSDRSLCSYPARHASIFMPSLQVVEAGADLTGHPISPDIAYGTRRAVRIMCVTCSPVPPDSHRSPGPVSIRIPKVRLRNACADPVTSDVRQAVHQRS
ncbi:hypothetical protein CC80DRAFT_496460 [Byssothecium circinans]|uniref:Uncharacterized protein n=1 Tax=Byssothecium circinans TaxID=147558 RepID=A0A6A5TDT1_9PLEO|nr:hypothetical protein CC80DRAFT_496460 [Byssothecium circinans]